RAGGADRLGARARLGMARSYADPVARCCRRCGTRGRGVLAGPQSRVHLLPVLMPMRWLVTWLSAIAVVAIAAALFEGELRHRGYVPTIQDDEDLWSLQADRLRGAANPIALLGASRIQFAVDPARVERATGRTTAMLAINGAYPAAALRWLARDTSFHGLAIVGVDSRGLDRRHWEMQQPWIDHYEHRWTFARKVHRLLLTPLQQYLVFMRSPFAWVALVRRELAGLGMPFNDYLVMRADRVGFL